MSSIQKNIELIRNKISLACERSGRDPKEIILLAATKDVPSELVEQAILSGITHLGENRVQEAETKIGALKHKYPAVTWHMIGHLQTNKIKRAVEIFDIIESIDSIRLAEEIDARCEAPARNASHSDAGGRGERREVFIEVNVSGEPQKFGVDETKAEDLVRNISRLKDLKITGLMTVPPFSEDPESSRPYFRKLRDLREKISGLNLPNVELKYLSMGMTDDYEAAVGEGSNIVRIGRGIFGIGHGHK